MNRVMYIFKLVVCLMTSLAFSLPAWSTPTAQEYGVVLNLSGKQRMLSQKMSKEVTLIALGFKVEEYLKNLSATSSLFDKTLTGLRDGDASLGLPPTTSKRILRQLGKVDKVWLEMSPVITSIITSKSVSKDQLDAVASQNTQLLKQMNKAVGLYEKDAAKNGLKSSPDLAVTINLAGKQRMLTQKMSKEFFLIALGYQVEDNKLNLLDTYTLFDLTLEGLQFGDDVLGLVGTQSPDITTQLKKVDGLWVDFMPVITSGASNDGAGLSEQQVSQIAEANLPLLKEMNAAVMLYEQEAAK